MCPLNQTQKDKKLEQLIPAGVQPEEISEVELRETAEEEAGIKKEFEKAEEIVEEQAKELRTGALDLESAEHLAKQTAAVQDPELRAIQNILQQDVVELFFKLSAEEQKKFKEEGVRIAKKIKGLLQAAKVNVKKIIDLIRQWLSRLPGINKHFIDQEAKIKLDRLLAIKKHQPT